MVDPCDACLELPANKRTRQNSLLIDENQNNANNFSPQENEGILLNDEERTEVNMISTLLSLLSQNNHDEDEMMVLAEDNHNEDEMLFDNFEGVIMFEEEEEEDHEDVNTLVSIEVDEDETVALELDDEDAGFTTDDDETVFLDNDDEDDVETVVFDSNEEYHYGARPLQKYK